jgi:hypothetical protein
MKTVTSRRIAAYTASTGNLFYLLFMLYMTDDDPTDKDCRAFIGRYYQRIWEAT